MVGAGVRWTAARLTVDGSAAQGRVTDPLLGTRLTAATSANSISMERSCA